MEVGRAFVEQSVEALVPYYGAGVHGRVGHAYDAPVVVAVVIERPLVLDGETRPGRATVVVLAGSNQIGRHPECPVVDATLVVVDQADEPCGAAVEVMDPET